MPKASQHEPDTTDPEVSPPENGSASVELTGIARPPHSRLLVRLVPEVVVLIGCGVLYAQTADYTAGATGGPGPAVYPRLLIILLAVAVAVSIAQQVRGHLRQRSGVVAGANTDELADQNQSRTRVLVAMGMAIGYVIATVYIGWVLATVALVTGFLYLAGKRRLLLTVPLACVIATVFSFVFVNIVYIALPTGVGIFDEFTYRFFVLIGAY